jgi:hypothetical protein
MHGYIGFVSIVVAKLNSKKKHQNKITEFLHFGTTRNAPTWFIPLPGSLLIGVWKMDKN